MGRRIEIMCMDRACQLRREKTRLLHYFSYHRRHDLFPLFSALLIFTVRCLCLLDTTTSRKKSETESVASESNVSSTTYGKDGSASGSGVECQPTGIYTVPDSSECNAYYQCDKGVRTKLNCPERQSFDADKHQCLDYERVACGARAVNLADKNQCMCREKEVFVRNIPKRILGVGKRDGIHPDTERDCRFYYQCVGQNKMREAKCPADQKFSSYIGKCASASYAPMPCGTYIPGSASIACKFYLSFYSNLLPSFSSSSSQYWLTHLHRFIHDFLHQFSFLIANSLVRFFSTLILCDTCYCSSCLDQI